MGPGTGLHESIIPAALSRSGWRQIPAIAYGLFTAAYAIPWVLGSAIIGVLYDRSVAAVVAFCLVVQLAALRFSSTSTAVQVTPILENASRICHIQPSY